MRKRIVWLLIVFAIALLSVSFGILLGSAARAATDCLAAPNAQPPSGSHWYYRVDRVKKRKCWYMGPQGAKVRSDASQVASPELLRAAPPTAPTSVKQP